MSKNDIWNFKYDIIKQDGTPFYKDPAQARLPNGQEQQTIKQGAEEMKDRFDFKAVRITVKNTNTGEELAAVASEDGGLQQEWVGGKGEIVR